MLLLLRLLKVEAEEAGFIGDELETDIRGAKSIGIKSVLLARPGYVLNQQTDVFPDQKVSSLTEFEELLAAGEL